MYKYLYSVQFISWVVFKNYKMLEFWIKKVELLVCVFRNVSIN